METVIALDTNVLVRFLVADDPAQAERARALVASGPTFVPRTVLLETEWVLRGALGHRPEAIRLAFDSLLGLPDLEVEDAGLVRKALGAYEAGVDLADALHHAASARAESLATFDRRLVLAAARAGLQPPVTEPPRVP